MPDNIQLYGATWCPKSSAIRNYLQSLWVEFQDLDVEANAVAAQRVKDQYNGHLKFPVLQVGDEWLVNPKPEELRAKLKEHGLLDD